MENVKKIMEGLKHRWFLMAMVCLISLSAVSTAGCAGRTRTSAVTTQTTDSGSGLGSSSSTSSTTTQKEVTTDAHPRGVIGGIFYTIGQVLIWPFKVIGSLFS